MLVSGWRRRLLLMLGVSVVVPHVALVREGYKLEAAKAERPGAARPASRRLDVREASLLSPVRLNDIAKERNLTSPMSSQVFHLDGQNPQGNSRQHPDKQRQMPNVPGGKVNRRKSVEVRGRSTAVNHRLASMAVICFCGHWQYSPG